MACLHVNDAALRPPGPGQNVYREDCTQCFDSIDDPSGLDVCLYCFNGGCTGDSNHSKLHSTIRQHPLVLNIKRTRKSTNREEPPQKITKLAISAETEADRFETKSAVRCYECQVDNVDPTAGRLSDLIDGIMKANTFSRQEEVKAWEQEMTTCEHILTLAQETPRKIASQDLCHCSMCELQENLWLCLQCGNLGCGRAQFGGVGGNSHGLAHADASHHSVAVKLGSITPEGTADVYCYSCNEERLDDDLGTHLRHWGILLAERQKTEKSLTEMQIEQNLKWEFSMTTEDGKELTPVFGPGFTGLKNLGNSCYLASSIQCLFALPQFQHRYYIPHAQLPVVQDPAQDLETQLRKMADGLLSGRYSHPDLNIVTSNPAESQHQRGLEPSMFKHLVGRGHVEFSTMRQQDAFEFLQHLFKLITRSKHPAPLVDPTKSFMFSMEQRLQCLSCERVRYSVEEQDNISIPVPIHRLRPDEKKKNIGEKDIPDQYKPVTLKECLDSFTSEEIVELTCPACGSKDGFSKRSLFKTFPETLAVNARRFVLINWVPTKVDVPVVVGNDAFNLDEYKSTGYQDSEVLLPEDSINPASSSFAANPSAMESLQQMGFPANRCEKALYVTGNDDVNAAMEWLFAHMEDADIDEPLIFHESQAGDEVIDAEKVENLGQMGFGPAQARKALKETQGNLERAVDWLFNHPDDQGDIEGVSAETTGSNDRDIARSEELPAKFQLQSIICHKGASIHAGHYVAFIRKQIFEENTEAWVLFNDEKVVKVVADQIEEMKRFAYVYLFQRTR